LFNCQENLRFYFRGTGIKLIIYFIYLFIYIIQASSEHPLAKAVLAYARHFHFFDDSSATTENDAKSGWLFDVSDFSALPGRGVQCIINGRRILVLSLY
jgi:cation transport ATPase